MKNSSKDSPNWLPQVPDYFGFIMGFLLIWLIYTGFGAVRGVFIQTHKKAVELTSKAKVATTESVVALQGHAKDLVASQSELVSSAKDKVEELQLKLETSRARLSREESKTKQPVERKNWSREQLKKANVFINDLISTLGETITGISEEEAPVQEEPVAPSETVNRNDSLEWFH